MRSRRTELENSSTCGAALEGKRRKTGSERGAGKLGAQQAHRVLEQQHLRGAVGSRFACHLHS